MKTFKAQYLGEIARYYNVKTETLKTWLHVHPTILEKVENFKQNNQKILPPILVKEIYEALGEK